MDKYQEFMLSCAFRLNSAKSGVKGSTPYQVKGFVSEKTGRRDCGTFDFEKDTITIVQDEDVYSTIYKHKIDSYYLDSISSDPKRGRSLCGELHSTTFSVHYLSDMSVTRDGKNWESISLPCSGENSYKEFEIILDFNCRISKVKFSFDRNLADDYVMDVIYVEADKEAYHRRKVEEDRQIKRQKLIEAANIECNTGDSLVNIYFAPCNDHYKHTEIELFQSDRLLAKYQVEENRFYHSVKGLAYGSYLFVLKQYDKNDNQIFETDKIVFTIVKPHNGRPSM